MGFKDLSQVENRQSFNLYLPPDASKERRIVHRKYVAAIEALAAEHGDPAAALAGVERARKNYGAILLREDRQARPHIYAR